MAVTLLYSVTVGNGQSTEIDFGDLENERGLTAAKRRGVRLAPSDLRSLFRVQSGDLRAQDVFTDLDDGFPDTEYVSRQERAIGCCTHAVTLGQVHEVAHGRSERLFKARRVQEPRVAVGTLAHNNLRQQLANPRGVLEPVPTVSARHDYAWLARQPADNELVVR
jgi:hypothetical protein